MKVEHILSLFLLRNRLCRVLVYKRRHNVMDHSRGRQPLLGPLLRLGTRVVQPSVLRKRPRLVDSCFSDFGLSTTAHSGSTPEVQSTGIKICLGQ